MVERRDRRSLRLRGYDYSQPGMYFVTICTQGRGLLFGDVVEGKMMVNQMGWTIEEEWLKTPTLRSYVVLDEFVVMPNHFHAILMIVSEGRGTWPMEKPGRSRAPTMEQFGKPVSGSLPTIIRSFKSAVTKRVNDLRGPPGLPVWQRDYYEHIIRDEDSLRRIRDYILTNPLRWELDQENPARRGEDEFDRWLASLPRKDARARRRRLG